MANRPPDVANQGGILFQSPRRKEKEKTEKKTKKEKGKRGRGGAFLKRESGNCYFFNAHFFSLHVAGDGKQVVREGREILIQ
jgi:hypothetical protein